MSDYIRVEGHSHLVRDRNTGAIINTNTNEMRMARVRKANRIKERNEIQEFFSDELIITRRTTTGFANTC